MSSHRAARSGLVLGLGALLLLGVVEGQRISADLSTARDLHGEAFAGSTACRRCHQDHYRTWHRTYHRTMTSDATEDTVLGRFDGRKLDYRGWSVQLDRDGEDFVMRVLGPDGQRQTHPVARTVGSHRYQQYLTRQGDTYYRLPVAWHVEEERFFHMNGAFLTPDPAARASQEDFERHVTRWNDNCIFCHNVGPNPGQRGDGFMTEVAELGVACEACHGPGAAHVAASADPARRYALHSSDVPDPTIVNPDRLDKARSADICGRCHGQRITDDVGRFLEHGDPFVPGDDLARYSEPLWRDSTLQGAAVFTPRFWEEGSPRLTAYEYQGWLQARCATGDLTCTTCHGMHEGDPSGQVRVDQEGDAMCTSCHDLEADHNRHRFDQSGSAVECVDCHMPRIVYGVLDAHRTHRIEVPRPDEKSRPDACTLCHVDKSRRWASQALSFLWSSGPEPTESPQPAEALRLLLGGDPIERALAADAMGRSAIGDPHVVAGWLLEAMEGDPYPAVRRLAWRGLRRIAEPELEVARFDVEAPKEARAEVTASLYSELDAIRLPPSFVGPLRQTAQSQAIEIGE